MDITCAILAGGKSTRMGKDKATIEVCNKPLIQQVYEKAQHVFRKILIVSSVHEQFPGIDAPIVQDISPLRSSMVGIASALLSADTPYVFVLACDMPFVTSQSIEHVLKEIHGEDIIIPRTQYGWEALHAVYNRSCLSVMITHIGLQRLKITGILPFFSVREVWENPAFINGEISAFTNINVEEDLSLIQSLNNE
ncbi:MAG: molybdenum cofactor guanylyltransferase [Syntrophorhabdus sp.]